MQETEMILLHFENKLKQKEYVLEDEKSKLDKKQENLDEYIQKEANKISKEQIEEVITVLCNYKDTANIKIGVLCIYSIVITILYYWRLRYQLID